MQMYMKKEQEKNSLGFDPLLSEPLTLCFHQSHPRVMRDVLSVRKCTQKSLANLIVRAQ